MLQQQLQGSANIFCMAFCSFGMYCYDVLPIYLGENVLFTVGYTPRKFWVLLKALRSFYFARHDSDDCK